MEDDDATAVDNERDDDVAVADDDDIDDEAEEDEDWLNCSYNLCRPTNGG